MIEITLKSNQIVEPSTGLGGSINKLVNRDRKQYIHFAQVASREAVKSLDVLRVQKCNLHLRGKWSEPIEIFVKIRKIKFARKYLLYRSLFTTLSMEGTIGGGLHKILLIYLDQMEWERDEGGRIVDIEYPILYRQIDIRGHFNHFSVQRSISVRFYGDLLDRQILSLPPPMEIPSPTLLRTK